MRGGRQRREEDLSVESPHAPAKPRAKCAARKSTERANMRGLPASSRLISRDRRLSSASVESKSIRPDRVSPIKKAVDRLRARFQCRARLVRLLLRAPDASLGATACEPQGTRAGLPGPPPRLTIACASISIGFAGRHGNRHSSGCNDMPSRRRVEGA